MDQLYYVPLGILGGHPALCDSGKLLHRAHGRVYLSVI